MFYNEEDIEYYEKIASFGRKELITEIGKWKKKYKTNKLTWIPEDDLSKQSGDDLYFIIYGTRRPANLFAGGIAPSFFCKEK